jgi:hypothetical protein
MKALMKATILRDYASMLFLFLLLLLFTFSDLLNISPF